MSRKMIVLVQTTIIKSHILAALSKQTNKQTKHLFLTVLEAGNSRIKVLTDSVSEMSPLLGL